MGSGGAATRSGTGKGTGTGKVTIGTGYRLPDTSTSARTFQCTFRPACRSRVQLIYMCQCPRTYT